MAIPDRILRKPGPLDNDEKQIMRTHCEIGYNMLMRIPFLRDAAEIVLAHQEFFDGSGYPRGLARRTNSARSADILHCRCAGRHDQRPTCTAKALPMGHAAKRFARCSGTQFDPKMVEVFMSIPEQHWIELRENLGSPFRLTQLKNLKPYKSPTNFWRVRRCMLCLLE